MSAAPPACQEEGCPNAAAPLPPKPRIRGWTPAGGAVRWAEPRWNRWCSTHLWRRRHGRPMDAELRRVGQSVTERLVEGAYALLDAAEGGREGVRRARQRLLKVVRDARRGSAR